MRSLMTIIGIIGVLLLAYPLLLGVAFLTLATSTQLHAWVDAYWWFWPTLAGLLGCACGTIALARRLRVRPADLDLALRGGTSALVTGLVLMPMGMGVVEEVFGPLQVPPASLAEALFRLVRALAIAVGLFGAAMLALAPLGLAVARLREGRGKRRIP